MRARFLALLALALSGCALPGAAPRVDAPPPESPHALVFEPPADLPVASDLRATSGLYRQIPLVWDPVLRADVAGYVIERSTEREGPFRRVATLRDRGHLAWIDRGDAEHPLGDAATHFYRLRTFGHDGRVTEKSSEIAVATTAPPPDPPSGLSVYSRQPRSVPLSWDPSTDPIVAGYTVERSPSEEGPFEVIAELEDRHAAHLLDTGLGDLRVLYYRVSSRTPDGQHGPPSPVIRAVTKPVPLPPVGLRVAEQRLGSNLLSWEPNVERDLRAYRLLRLERDGTPWIVTEVPAASTRAEDPAIGAGERARYTVVAVDQDGLASRPSKALSIESVGYGLQARAEPAAVEVHWNPRREEGFVGARVTRSTWPWGRREERVEGEQLVDREVSPGRTYTYVVVLERADGSAAPASRPLAVEVPEEGERFVEIQEPAPRLPRPDAVPR